MNTDEIIVMWRLFESRSYVFAQKAEEMEVWNGGEKAPLADDVLVWKARFRDGVEVTITKPPSYYTWTHARDSADIVGYLPLVYMAETKGHPLHDVEWVFASPDSCPVPESAKCWQASVEGHGLTPVYAYGSGVSSKWNSLKERGKIVAYRFK